MYGLLGQDNIWPRYNYLKIWNLRVKLRGSFDIFTEGTLQNIFMEHDLYLIS